MMGEEISVPVTGAVFTFGKSRYADNSPSHFFIKNDCVTDVACGDEHTAVVCQTGRIFTFGNNQFGQLGLGHKNASLKPSCIKSLKPLKCVSVACGRSHTLILTDDGKVYSCGQSDEGQLGLGDLEDREVPHLIPQLDGIQHLSAGSAHSVAIINSGKVYVWGSNDYGQLGLSNKSVIFVPTLLDLNEDIIQVSCGYYHTLLLTCDRKMYVFGEGEFGKLGLGDEIPVSLPTKLHLDSEIVAISAGGNHSSAVTKDGKIFMWGSNDKGQLGIENIDKICRPSRVVALEYEQIVTASCGHTHTAVITAAGTLFTFGDNKHGKLAIDSSSEATTPMKINKFCNLNIHKVQCGGCHTMVLAFPLKHTDQVLNGVVKKFSTTKIIDSGSSSLSSSSLTSKTCVLSSNFKAPSPDLNIFSTIKKDKTPTSPHSPSSNKSFQFDENILEQMNSESSYKETISNQMTKSHDVLIASEDGPKDDERLITPKNDSLQLRKTSSLLQNLNTVSVIKPYRSEEYYTGKTGYFSNDEESSNSLNDFPLNDIFEESSNFSMNKSKSEIIDCSKMQYHVCKQLKELDKTVNILKENVDNFTNQFCHGTNNLQNTLQKVKSNFKCNKTHSSRVIKDKQYINSEDDNDIGTTDKRLLTSMSEWLLSSPSETGSYLVTSGSSCTYCKMCWKKLKKVKDNLSDSIKNNNTSSDSNDSYKRIIETNYFENETGNKTLTNVDCLIEEYHKSQDFGGAGDASSFLYNMKPNPESEEHETEEKVENITEEDVKGNKLSKLFFLKKKLSLSKSNIILKENLQTMNYKEMVGDAKKSRACTII